MCKVPDLARLLLKTSLINSSRRICFLRRRRWGRENGNKQQTPGLIVELNSFFAVFASYLFIIFIFMVEHFNRVAVFLSLAEIPGKHGLGDCPP